MLKLQKMYCLWLWTNTNACIDIVKWAQIALEITECSTCIKFLANISVYVIDV